MRSYKTEAIIIRRRRFGEKDRILTLFSEDEGKTEVLAKGARRPGSKLSYVSDIGSFAKFNISKTKSIDILKESELIFSPETIKGRYDSSQKLGYALKYVNSFFELNDPHPRTYKLLIDLIESISRNDTKIIFLSFILNLISDLGLEPELFSCSICSDKLKPNQKVVFSKKEGVQHLDCGDGESCSENDIKLMRVILNYSFKKVAKTRFNQSDIDRVYNLIKEYFVWHFNMDLPETI